MKLVNLKFRLNRLSQSGFTLMEIVVATAIFATVVSSTLALFTMVLNINRQVQAVRQVSQAARNFTEILSREIRNGRIDYNSSSYCNTQYSSSSNQALAIISYTGEKMCFALQATGQVTNLVFTRLSNNTPTNENINPPNVTINPNSFRFIVRPSVTMDSPTPQNKGIQPMVTILVEFEINKGARNQKIIPYQTTISTDVYDLPNINP